MPDEDFVSRLKGHAPRVNDNLVFLKSGKVKFPTLYI
jgi:hypothetical protein